ncbi:MAG: nicotinamide riboside transporter PnuC [Dysgonamonadaceae bacterium]|nr:nicotinamide riboside transporter PnuC [Dysgonamonadaceae bacterium]
MEIIEIVGAVIGLLYLYLEYKADKWLWPVGVLMPLIYVYIFFHAKFYADMGINVYYFFASVYGWIKWTKASGDEAGTPISSIPAKKIIPIAVVFALIFAFIAHILFHYTDSPVPIGDSLITALSIIAMWMLANKYIEQWWVWIVVNAISCGLYFWKDLNYTALLFVIYTIVPFFGYFKWKKLMKEQTGK